MAVESKVIVTAEDRTAAAFAAIERNTGRTSMAMIKLTSNMLALAGAGTFISFLRTNAEKTEKWRDEMARLDDITQKFFETAADAGKLNPLIQVVKAAHLAAFGATVVIENLGLAVGSLAAATVAAAKLEFSVAKRILAEANADMAANEARFAKLRDEINQDTPTGYLKKKEAEVERIKKLNESLKKSEEERLKMTLDNARAAEDAMRAEMEISAEFSQAGLTRMGETVVDEARQKRNELAAEAEAKQRERLTKSVQDLSESFMTEQQIEQMHYETKQQMLDDAFMQELISAEEQKRLLEELEINHQAKLGDVTAQAVLARRKFEQMNVTQQTQFVLGQVLQLTQGVAANNKTMFQINKMAGIANATINTAEGVTKALSAYPPPLSFVMAALQLAAGLAQIQQIKNAQFGSSSSAPSVGGGGATPVFNADTGVPAISSGQGPSTQTVQVNIPSDTGMVSTDWVRNMLIPGINDALGDGVKLLV